MTVSLKDVDKAYGDLTIFDGFDLEVEDGEFISIVGPSGCGKSTLLNIICGSAEADDGVIDIGGDSTEVSYVFQSPRLLDWRTVRRNLELALKNSSVDPDQYDEQIESFIEVVGLDPGILDMYPTQLSGGMRSRVGLIRGLVVPSTIVLMDEPLGAVDELTARQIRDEFLNIWKQSEPDKTILYVTHNVQEAVYLSDRVLVLSEKPATIQADISVDIERPRDVEDSRLFEKQNEVYDVLGV